MEDLTEMVKALNAKLEHIEDSHKTRMDAMANMIMQTNRRVQERENEEESSGHSHRHFDEDKGLKLDLP